MSKEVISPTPPKKDKEKKQKDKKKKEGKHLYSLFKKSKGFDRNVGDIPPIVREPIEWLISHNALGEEGIFRIPGSATEIKDLKLRYDKGKKVDLESILNVHTVAGLLKVFFRELPEPLLTFELYDAFLAAIKPEVLQTKLEFLSKVLEALPAGNKVILEHLMEFLFTVSTHKSNCMSVANIAIVFAPNLMRPKVERIEAILANSSNVNLIISLLIQHHEVLFRGKEFKEAESGADVVLSPQLISLKAAQAAHKSSTSISPSTTPSTADTDKPKERTSETSPDHSLHVPTKSSDSSGSTDTPTGAKRVLTRKGPSDKPMRRSQTVSTPSPTSGSEKKRTKRGAMESDDFSNISADDLNNASLALEGSLTPDTKGREIKRKKSRRTTSNGKDDQFFDTLKKGTVRLAATLLEEQELVLEMAEIDGLTVEERQSIEAKVAVKISESKSLRDNSRKQRQVQRTQSNFTRLRDGAKIHKRSSSDKLASSSSVDDDGTAVKKVRKVRKTPSTIAMESPTESTTPPSPLPPRLDSPSQPDSETSSVAEIEIDPEMAQFEEELDRQLSLEDENPLAEDSSSSSDSDSPDFELLAAPLPPPLDAPEEPESGDATWAGEANEEDSEEQRVVRAIMEGDMVHFQQYLGSMKRKKRLERSVSKKKILSRMSVNLSTLSETQEKPEEE